MITQLHGDSVVLSLGVQASDKTLDRIALDIKIRQGILQDILEPVQAGCFSSLLDQLDEQLLLHDIGFHGNIDVLSLAAVLVHCRNASCLVNRQCIAAKECLLAFIGGSVEHGDIRLGINMLLEHFIEVNGIHEVGRSDHDIRIVVLFDVLHVEHVVCNVMVVDL